MSDLTMLGEWSGEPDLLEFEAYGFKCQAKRHDNLGHLCGYITVGADHPWYSLEYSEIDVRVHGGLTFSNEGRFGFDCAHAGDLVPKMYHLMNDDLDETYKGLGFVVGELISLAKQAKEAVDQAKFLEEHERLHKEAFAVFSRPRRFDSEAVNLEIGKILTNEEDEQ